MKRKLDDSVLCSGCARAVERAKNPCKVPTFGMTPCTCGRECAKRLKIWPPGPPVPDTSNIPCKYYTTLLGCRDGKSCRFQHESPKAELNVSIRGDCNGQHCTHDVKVQLDGRHVKTVSLDAPKIANLFELLGILIELPSHFTEDNDTKTAASPATAAEDDDGESVFSLSPVAQYQRARTRPDMQVPCRGTCEANDQRRRGCRRR